MSRHPRDDFIDLLSILILVNPEKAEAIQNKVPPAAIENDDHEFWGSHFSFDLSLEVERLIDANAKNRLSQAEA